MKDVVQVAQTNLPGLSKLASTPRFDRSLLSPAILHFGVGGFHRAHQAAYAQDLLDRGGDGWALCGAGVLPKDAAMRDALMGQDCLYTLVEQSPARTTLRVIGSIVDYRYGPDDPEGLLRLMSDPGIKIVSLTVTEGGYYYDFGEKRLRLDEPAVREDLHGQASPVTWIGYIVSALDRRRASGTPPFTVLSCDNIPNNGRVARTVVSALAEARDSQLADFIRQEVSFPSTMVDRITPQTNRQDIARLEQEYGIRDAWPVFCEEFRQWVVEDEFVSGRPAWEEVGVQLVSDVTPYELAKIRLLNGAHSALAYVAYLLGYRRVDLAIVDTDIRRLVQGYMTEMRETLPEVPGWDLEDYCQTLIERFANPAIADQVTRLALEGSTKIANSIAPAAAQAVVAGKKIPHVAFAIAGWIRYCTGTDEEGQEIRIDDPSAERLQDLALKSQDDPTPFLNQQTIFPPELAANRDFHLAVQWALTEMRRHGVRRALGTLLEHHFRGL